MLDCRLFEHIQGDELALQRTQFGRKAVFWRWVLHLWAEVGNSLTLVLRLNATLYRAASAWCYHERCTPAVESPPLARD